MTVRSLTGRPRPVTRTIIDRARQLVAVWRPEQEQAMDITNRTVFIAGATSGIGLELARRFAAAGSDVIVGGRRAGLLGKLAAEGFAAVPIDVTDAASTGRARDTILRSHPGLDTIVTMSGIGIPEDLRDPAHFSAAQETIDTNLLGTIGDGPAPGRPHPARDPRQGRPDAPLGRARQHLQRVGRPALAGTRDAPEPSVSNPRGPPSVRPGCAPLDMPSSRHSGHRSGAGNVEHIAMPQDSDWSWLRAAVEAPDMILDLYETLPEDLARQIEVSDGTIIDGPLPRAR
jgi:short chain dehydrogenase